MYEDIKREKVVDAYHIFRKMRRDGYFALHAALRAMPSSTNTVRTTKSLDDLTTDTINTDTLTGVLDLDGLETAATAYQTARARDEGAGAGLAAQGALGSELRSIVMQHERLKYTRSVSASAPSTDEPPRKARTPQVGRGKKKSIGVDNSAEQTQSTAGGVGVIARYNMENGEPIVQQGGADLMNAVAVEHMPELGEFFAPEEEASFGHRALKASDLEPSIDVSPMQHNHHTPHHHHRWRIWRVGSS